MPATSADCAAWSEPPVVDGAPGGRRSTAPTSPRRRSGASTPVPATGADRPPATGGAGATTPDGLGRLSVFARLYYGSALYPLVLARAPVPLRAVPQETWTGLVERGQAILSDHLTLDTVTIPLDDTVWSRPLADPGLAAALHGFDWLRDLRAVGGDRARRRARTLIAAWLDRHGRWQPDSWRADILGQRIAAWLGHFDFFYASADDGFRERVEAATRAQIRHLYRLPRPSPEHPAAVSVARGVAAGIAAHPPTPRQRLADLTWLGQMAQAQTAPDGGHVSRNPRVVLAVLRAFIDMRGALRSAGLDPPDSLLSAIDRLTAALRFFRYGDGGLAVVQGGERSGVLPLTGFPGIGAEGQTVALDQVLAQADARGRPLRSMPQTGYERVVAGRTLLMVDTGGPAPGAAAAWHAAPLALEVAAGRERLVVNCGAYPGPHSRPDGAPSPWVAALRSIAAHSALELGGVDPAPGDPAPRGPAVLVEREQVDGATLVTAQHSFYRQRFGFDHRRRIYLSAAGDDIRGEDALIPAGPQAARGPTAPLPFALRFHLHPRVQASMTRGSGTVLLRPGAASGWIFRATADGIAVADDGDEDISGQIETAAETAMDGVGDAAQDPAEEQAAGFADDGAEGEDEDDAEGATENAPDTPSDHPRIALEDSLYFGSGTRRRCQMIVIAGTVPPGGLTLRWGLKRAKRG